MARQFTKPLDLMKHQMKRFAAMNMNAKTGHADIARQGYMDARELTRGADGPMGSARKRWLRKMGHPFGRGPSAAASKPGGLKRGIPRARGQVRNLPIGQISNRLHTGFSLKRETGGTQSFGLRSSAPHAQYILSPYGTKKMVGRGFGGILGKSGPKTGEIVRRWRARNMAFVQHFIRKQRTI